MTNYNWNYPTTMWVGENRVKDLHLACKNLNKISFSQDNIYFFDKNGNRLRKTT